MEPAKITTSLCLEEPITKQYKTKIPNSEYQLYNWAYLSQIHLSHFSHLQNEDNGIIYCTDIQMIKCANIYIKDSVELSAYSWHNASNFCCFIIDKSDLFHQLALFSLKTTITTWVCLLIYQPSFPQSMTHKART